MIEKSDIIIHLVEFDYFNENLLDFGISTENKTVIKVLNKSDLLTKNQMDFVETQKEMIKISAKTGEGIDKLFEMFKNYLIDQQVYSEDVAVISNIRHLNSLKSAKESLINAKQSLIDNQSNEFVAIDLRKAANSLKELTGEITSEEILNSIFSKFCIGK